MSRKCKDHKSSTHSLRLDSPYWYFGGKAVIAPKIWGILGNSAKAVVDPFMGGNSFILSRPSVEGQEIVNDIDGMIVNFWRSVKNDPDKVAFYADNPVHESTIHAVNYRLSRVRATLTDRLEADDSYFDAKIAGDWVWGFNAWLGTLWASSGGGWSVIDGKLVFVDKKDRGSYPNFVGVRKKRPAIAERGVHRRSYRRSPISFEDWCLAPRREMLYEWLRALSARVRDMHVLCGDYRRLFKPIIMPALNERKPQETIVFLDPPYTHRDRYNELYSNEDDRISYETAKWAIENGNNPNLKIVYFAYSGNHEFPDDWSVLSWTARGGLSNAARNPSQARKNRFREVIYFSPHCFKSIPDERDATAR